MKNVILAQIEFTMKTARIFIAVSLFAVATSFSYAGPGAQYFQQRRAERVRVAATAPDAPKSADSCCRVVTVQRPFASHKISTPVKSVECSGCTAMAAGEKCQAS